MQIRIPVTEVPGAVHLWCNYHNNRVLIETAASELGGLDLSDSFCAGLGKDTELIDDEIRELVSKMMNADQYNRYQHLMVARGKLEDKCRFSWELIIDSLSSIDGASLDEAIDKMLQGDGE
jgi:hypothetical protein